MTRRRVLVGALTALTALAAAALFATNRPGDEPWSEWAPADGDVASMTEQISEHVETRYRSSADGKRLVRVVPTDASIATPLGAINVRAIAIRAIPGQDAGIRAIYDMSGTRFYSLCGVGANCAIDDRSPSVAVSRLVRREALELALYTFKYVPSVDTILTFIPAPTQATARQHALFFEKRVLRDQLRQPLRQTLPLAASALPGDGAREEAATIDGLTEAKTFTVVYPRPSSGGFALILDPAS